MTQTKVLPIAVPPDLYAILERKAQAEDRDAVQQARYMLKEVLRAEAQPVPEAPPTRATE